MRRFLNPFLALLVALLLLGGQQAALAHMVGHIAAQAGGNATAQTQPDDDSHGAALALSDVCATCLAFAGADATPPRHPIPTVFATDARAASLVAVPPAPTFAFIAAFRSRAPPAL